MPKLDTTQPLMIEGMPDASVYIIGRHPGGQYEGNVRRGAFTTHITFRDNGWITSTTYPTDRVINRSTHDAAMLKREQDGIETMQSNPLWGSF